MGDRRLFSSDYVFKTIKNEHVENIIKNVRKTRRTTKNDVGMWEEYCDHDMISVKSSKEVQIPNPQNTIPEPNSSRNTPMQSTTNQNPPIKVRRLSDVEIKDLIDRAINEVVKETSLTGRSQEIQNKPRKNIKRLDRIGNVAPPSVNFHQGDGAQNVVDENDNKPKLEVIYNNKKPVSAKRFINKLENITEMVSQENFENIRSIERIQNIKIEERKSRHPKLINQRISYDNSYESYPMVIKSSETINAPIKKSSIIMPPETGDAPPEGGSDDQSRLSDSERYEMMRLVNKKRRQLKKESIAVEEAIREGSQNLPEIYITNDGMSNKCSSIEMKSKQLGKITNYQQKSMNVIDQLRFNLLEIQNVGIDSKIVKFYSSSNSFLVNFSKNFLEKINAMIADLPSLNVSQQILVVNLKIYEALQFYIKNKMFATYDHNLEKLDELINIVSTSILISFEFNIFDENDLISQRFLQECRNLSSCIKNIQRKKELYYQKNPQANLSKRFNMANSPRTTEQGARYAMYGLNVKEPNISSKGKVQNTKSKTKPKFGSSQISRIHETNALALDKTSILGKHDVPAKRGYSQKEIVKKGSSKRGTKKDSCRSRSQQESKTDLDDDRSDQSLKVIYPICDDFVNTMVENIDVDEMENLTPYIPKPLTFTNGNLENSDMSATYRFDCNDSNMQKLDIGMVKQEFLKAVVGNLEEYMSNETINQAQQDKNLEKHLQNMQTKDRQQIEQPLINEFLRLELDNPKFKI